MGQILAAFAAETDSESKQNLLAAAQELAASGPEIRQLLGLALKQGQPLEVQRQALYLAMERDVKTVQAVASNPAHWLFHDAEALLLEAKLALGIRLPPKEEAASEAAPGL